MKDRGRHQESSETPTELPDAVGEGESALRHWLRPYVIVDLVPRHFVNILYFRIRNVGQLPAYQIQLSVDQPITIGGKDLSKLNLFVRGIGVMAPQDELSFFFGSVLELFNKEGAILQFTVQVKYSGPGGDEYVDEYAMDAELLRQLAVELPASDKMDQQLERIKKEVERLASYADQIRMQDLQRRVEEAPGHRDRAVTEDEPEA